MKHRVMLTKLMRSMALTVTATSLLTMYPYCAQADPAECLGRAMSYFAQMDQLLSKEKNWIIPFIDLNARFGHLEDCDTDALLEEVVKWRYAQPIIYNPRAKEYLVRFSSRDVTVGFAYSARERKSDTHSAGWVRK
jgi:hypothetical protein